MYSTHFAKRLQDHIWDLAFAHNVELLASPRSAEDIDAHAAACRAELAKESTVSHEDLRAVVASLAIRLRDGDDSGDGDDGDDNLYRVEVLPDILEGANLSPVRVAVLFHEFGHIIHPDGMSRDVSESLRECYAWQWAMAHAKTLRHTQGIDIGWDMACHEMMLVGLEQRLFVSATREPTAEELAEYDDCMACSIQLLKRE